MNNLYLYGYYIFRIQRAIKFGDAVYVYGSSSQLGDWKIENAKRLELFDNNLWLSQLYLEKKHYEYKFFISNYNKPNNSNFTLIDDKGSAFTIEPEHLLSKNSGITMLINDHCESDIEKYSPDFIINNEKKKLARVVAIRWGLTFLVVFVFILLCPIVVKLLTAGKYMESVPYARVFALVSLTNSIYYIVL